MEDNQGFLGEVELLEITGSEKFVVPCEQLSKIVQSLEKEEIYLKYEKPFLKITSSEKDILFEVNSLDAEEFPIFNYDKETSIIDIELNSIDLLDLFQKT